MVKHICAWCRKLVDITPGDNYETHGICPECRAKELKKLDRIGLEKEGKK